MWSTKCMHLVVAVPRFCFHEQSSYSSFAALIRSCLNAHSTASSTSSQMVDGLWLGSPPGYTPVRTRIESQPKLLAPQISACKLGEVEPFELTGEGVV